MHFSGICIFVIHESLQMGPPKITNTTEKCHAQPPETET